MAVLSETERAVSLLVERSTSTGARGSVRQVNSEDDGESVQGIPQQQEQECKESSNEDGERACRVQGIPQQQEREREWRGRGAAKELAERRASRGGIQSADKVPVFTVEHTGTSHATAPPLCHWTPYPSRI